ncbi:MAG: hypothetical protein DCF18_04200 [Cyanobium sp.]|nr:MAG: hypothetical protein DCF18_04200 [Cyanobium sp.]
MDTVCAHGLSVRTSRFPPKAFSQQLPASCLAPRMISRGAKQLRFPDSFANGIRSLLRALR